MRTNAKELSRSTVAFLLILFLNLLLGFTSHAEASEIDESMSLIYKMDAVVRDCSDYLNIREKPTASSKVVGTINEGEHLEIIDQDGKWFAVKYGDISGYVFWKYIEFTEPDKSETPDLIGSSIIHYCSSTNRDINMSVSASTITGTHLNPGEEFRWSKIVGKATAEKGYKEATIIVGKQYVKGYGGGNCQVSTTLYNALLDTDIKPTERHSHSLTCAYAKEDATVSYGSKDFAFTNTYDFPIEIECYTYKGTVFCNIYKVEN